MKVNIIPDDKEIIDYNTMKKILNYLSKELNVYFSYHLGHWEISAIPKQEQEK